LSLLTDNPLAIDSGFSWREDPNVDRRILERLKSNVSQRNLVSPMPTVCSGRGEIMKKKLIAAVLLTMVFGCISVSKSILASNPTGQVFTAEEVTVYFETDSIPEHTRLAILNAKGDSDMTDEGEMIDELREEAGTVGANAIILDAFKEPGTGQRVVAAIFGTTKNRKVQAIAIYVPSLDEERSTSSSDG
jgi:hypothetical protein